MALIALYEKKLQEKFEIPEEEILLRNKIFKDYSFTKTVTSAKKTYEAQIIKIINRLHVFQN